MFYISYYKLLDRKKVVIGLGIGIASQRTDS